MSLGTPPHLTKTARNQEKGGQPRGEVAEQLKIEEGYSRDLFLF